MRQVRRQCGGRGPTVAGTLVQVGKSASAPADWTTVDSLDTFKCTFLDID